MGDIKLFRMASDAVNELTGTTDTIEKSVQTLFERDLRFAVGCPIPGDRIHHDQRR